MREESRLQVRNSARRNGPGRWDWAVWIEGPTEKLDEIDHVKYILHPTFPQPIRTVLERSSNFRLDSRGYGEFLIHVEIATKDAQILQLDHWITFRNTTGTDARSDLDSYSPGKLTVFVSYSRADFPVFKVFRKVLEEHNLKVVTADASRLDQPWESEVKSLIGNAHAVVALLSEEPSRWVITEIAEALRQHVTVVPVLLGNAALPTDLADLKPVLVKNPRDQGEIVATAEDQLAQVGL